MVAKCNAFDVVTRVKKLSGFNAKEKSKKKKTCITSRSEREREKEKKTKGEKRNAKERDETLSK